MTAAVGIAVACLAASLTAPPVFDVRDFGTVGDGVTDDTPAFEAAISAVNHTHQLSTPAQLPLPGLRATTDSVLAQVLVPGLASAGKRLIFLIRPISLTSRMELLIEDGAAIAGVADHAKWPLIPPVPSYGQGRDHPGLRYASLLHGEKLHNVRIRGEGSGSVIDGRGDYWWARHHARTETHTRGHLIELMWSSDIEIANLTMRDSPFWNTHFFDCDRVHVRGVRILAPNSSPNTDGWDPDSSRNVLIEDSTYSGGDDCVAIKSGWDCHGVAYGVASQNITVRNVSCEGRYAGIAIGSEISGGVDGVLVENVSFTKANGPAHIKTGASRGGFVTNVRFVNLTVADGAPLTEGILVDTNYGDVNPSCPKGWKPPQPTLMANYTFEHIDARKARVQNSPFHFMGAAGADITGVRIRDVWLPAGRGHHNWSCTHVSGEVVKGTVAPWPPCPEFRVVADE